MKQLIFALVAVAIFGVGSAFAQSYSHKAPPTAQQAQANR